jgi:carbonic anhydrase/acetyltransferase-like protein (isoleucine patch superfamily)
MAEFPSVHPSSYIASSAVLIGMVTIGKRCGIFPHAVLRGDQNEIVIGDGSNIQDCCVVHADLDHACHIGAGVTVGHAAVVHGAEIEDDCLVGIHATVLNGARIGAGSIIGACALVTENQEVPPNSLVLGVPGKVVKQSEQFLQTIRRNAEVYEGISAGHAQGRYPYYTRA